MAVRSEIVARVQGALGGGAGVEEEIDALFDAHARWLNAEHPWNFALRESRLTSAVAAGLVSGSLSPVTSANAIPMRGNELFVDIVPIPALNQVVSIGGGRTITIGGGASAAPLLKVVSSPLKWIYDESNYDILPIFERNDPDNGEYWIGPFRTGSKLTLRFREADGSAGWPVPQRCLRVLHLDGGGTKFDVRSNVIYARNAGEEPQTFAWIEDMTLFVEQWSESFADVFAASLASQIAYKVTGSGNTTIALRKVAQEKLAFAKKLDSQEGSPNPVFTPSVSFGSRTRFSQETYVSLTP